MSKTIIEHERALERMLTDVQEEKNRWLTLATATLDISKSNRRMEEKVDRLEEKVDRLEEKVDKRFDAIDRKFDQVDKRFGIIEDDLRFVKSHIELVVGLALGKEQPKQDPTEQ